MSQKSSSSAQRDREKEDMSQSDFVICRQIATVTHRKKLPAGRKANIRQLLREKAGSALKLQK